MESDAGTRPRPRRLQARAGRWRRLWTGRRLRPGRGRQRAGLNVRTRTDLRCKAKNDIIDEFRFGEGESADGGSSHVGDGVGQVGDGGGNHVGDGFGGDHVRDDGGGSDLIRADGGGGDHVRPGHWESGGFGRDADRPQGSGSAGAEGIGTGKEVAGVGSKFFAFKM